MFVILNSNFIFLCRICGVLVEMHKYLFGLFSTHYNLPFEKYIIRCVAIILPLSLQASLQHNIRI